MTVSSQTSRAAYQGNGSTKTYPVPFYFLADAHISVLVRAANGTEALLTLGTDYSVSGSGNPAGGAVTLATAPASGASVTVVRNVPATQETDYQPNDPFPANTHEMALDKLTMLAQQSYEQLGRTIRISASSGASAADLVASAAVRAGKVLGFDASGNPVAIVNNTDAAKASEDAAKASEDAANAAKVAAQAAQTAAENARDQTLLAYDNFDDRYLGPKATNPTVDNDGNALVGGTLYYNTVAQRMRLWTGSQWIDAYVAGNASGIAFTPTGGVAANNVQAAIAELDAEIAAINPTLADGSITTAKLADGAVTSAKVSTALMNVITAGGSVADGSITTAKLAAQAATPAKIDLGAWTTVTSAATVDLGAQTSRNIILDYTQQFTPTPVAGFQNGTFATDTVWSKGTGVTISGGVLNVAAIAPNPTFSTDTVWTKGSGVTIANGVMSCNNVSGQLFYNLSLVSGLVAGRTYSVSFDYTYTGVAGGALKGAGGAATPVYFTTPALSASGTINVSYAQTANTGELSFYTVNQNFTGTIDNLYLTDTIIATQAVQFTVGRTYTVSLTYTNTGDARAKLRFVNSTIEANLVYTSPILEASGTLTFDFVAVASSGFAILQEQFGFTGTIDDITINEQVPTIQTITSFGSTVTPDNIPFNVRAAKAHNLTNGANLICPGGADLALAAGDVIVAAQESAGVWRVIDAPGLGEAGIRTLFNASGAAPVYAARAWVNFNGTGTVAIRGSGNVLGITDNGTGSYTVNFATAMPDINYSVCGVVNQSLNSADLSVLCIAGANGTVNRSLSGVSLVTGRPTYGAVDASEVSVVITR